MSFSFALSVDIDSESGDIQAVYFRVRDGKVAKTKEYAEGAIFADFNSRGRLLGIEMLAPCNISVLERVAAQSEQPAQAKQFVRRAVPREMVLTQ
jgi:uncharacterized protein YuzE